MNPLSPDHSHDRSDVESEFYNVIELLTDECQRGQPINLTNILTRYPQFAERLEAIVPTLQLIGNLGRRNGGPGEPAQVLLPTNTLGDFRIKREIGRGGMGVVYEAEQLSLSRTVALKILPMAAVLPEHQIERFKHEARAAAALHHPNIVPVFTVGVVNGIHYYSMQYIEGQSLGETPTAQSVNPVASTSQGHWRRVAEIGIQIADALEYAHALGIVHRDVKPANLLVDVSGKAWLADFGLAQFRTEATFTMTGDIIGTLRYMSPEQASGERGTVDHRTDIYSLGATLYELATGMPAFDHADRLQLLRKVLECRPIAPRKINPGIPTDLETILLTAMAKERQDRYVTSQALSDDLRHFLDNRPPLAKRPTWSELAMRWSARHLGAVIALMTILVLLTIGLSAAIAVVWRAQSVAEAARSRTSEALRFANEQRIEAELQSQNAKQLAVNLAFDRGLGLCTQGELAHGLLWLSRALELVPRDQPQSQSIIRMNLHDWSQRLIPLTNIRRLIEGEFTSAVAFDSGSNRIAVAYENVVHVWDIASNELVGQPIRCLSNVTSLSFCPGADAILIGTFEGQVQAYSIFGGESAGPVHRHNGFVDTVAVGSNGMIVLSAGINEPVHFWSPVTGALFGAAQQTQPPAGLASFGGSFSPDGKTAVTWTGGIVSYWDVEPSVNFRGHLIESDAQTLTAVIGFDGKQLLVGRASNAVLCELPSGKSIGSPMSFLDHVSAVAFDSHDRFCLVGSRDRRARLFRANDQVAIGQSLEHERPIRLVAFEAEDKSFYTACDGGLLKQWATPSQNNDNVVPISADVTRLCLTPDAKTVFTAIRRPELAGDVVQIREVASGSLIHETVAGHSVEFMTLSSDGRLLTTASQDQIRVWNVATGESRSSQPKTPVDLSLRAELKLARPAIRSLAMNPATNVVAVGLNDRIHLFDANHLTATCLPLAHAGAVECLKYSRDGTLLFSASSRLNQCWNSSTGQVLCQLETVPSRVVDVALPDDGQSVITADVRGRVFQYSLHTGKRTSELLRQTYQSRTLALSSDGKTAVAVGGDGRAKILDLGSGHPVGPDRQHYGPMAALAFAGDDQTIATLVPAGGASEVARDIYVAKTREELSGDPAQITLWVEVTTGMALDHDQIPSLLTPEAWHDKKARLSRQLYSR
jgi:WD40 repeat protein